MVDHRNIFYYSFLLLLCIALYFWMSILKVINTQTKIHLVIFLLVWLRNATSFVFISVLWKQFCSAPRVPAVYLWQDVPSWAISRLQVWKSQQPQTTVWDISQSFCGAGALCLGYRSFLPKSLAPWANMNLLNALCLEINIKFNQYLSPS